MHSAKLNESVEIPYSFPNVIPRAVRNCEMPVMSLHNDDRYCRHVHLLLRVPGVIEELLELLELAGKPDGNLHLGVRPRDVGGLGLEVDYNGRVAERVIVCVVPGLRGDAAQQAVSFVHLGVGFEDNAIIDHSTLDCTASKVSGPVARVHFGGRP
jgi:hypothetical protein